MLFYVWVPLHGVKPENRKNNKTPLWEWVQEILCDTHNIFNLCTPSNGCKIMNGNNLCSTGMQSCFGSPRCCRDYIVQSLTTVTDSLVPNKTDLTNINLSLTNSIVFEDFHTNVIGINIVMSFIILTAHIIVVYVLAKGMPASKTISIKTTNSVFKGQDTFNENASRDIVFSVIIFSIITSNILGCLIVIAYTTAYFIINFGELLKCQTAFVLLISWIWLYILHLFNQVITILPDIRYDYDKVPKIWFKDRYMKMNHTVHPFWCKQTFEYILTILSSLSLIWWIIMPVYFLV